MISFLRELRDWKITPEYNFGRIQLTGGDNTAREHYQNVIDENPLLILEIAKGNKEILQAVEERAAIREADGLPGDLESAVLCNFTETF